MLDVRLGQEHPDLAAGRLLDDGGPAVAGPNPVSLSSLVAFRISPSRPATIRSASASASSRPRAPCSRTRRDAWPVVLVLEDLHLADKPTALMLTNVVRSIQAERVLIIGTYRDTDVGEPLAGVLADLRRDRALERLRLGSLHRGEVATMISAWLGRRRRRTSRTPSTARPRATRSSSRRSSAIFSTLPRPTGPSGSAWPR